MKRLKKIEQPEAPHSESNVQSRTRLRVVPWRWRLWRNNRGAGKLASGNHVRFGLANDSKILGDQLKSGDLIGWRPVVITADMVGKTIAQFVSLECKPESWTPSLTDEHEIAQRRWANLINQEGGYAAFISDPETQLIDTQVR